MNDGIIIQARSGSTRMPAKILQPFEGKQRIIDIIIDNIVRDCPERTIVLATTANTADDILESVAYEHGIQCFRGPEDDVLARFIGAAEKFSIDRIIRVCSDNPFLQTASFEPMFKTHNENATDYLAYGFPDGRPTIKSHLGLYAELTTADALCRAWTASEEKLYREHVTIYLYTHPKDFSIHLMPLPDFLQNRTDLRLTLDTPSDFKLLSELYHIHKNETDGTLTALVNLIDSNPAYGKIMKQNIVQNEK